MAASIAIIAMTTSSSISVNPPDSRLALGIYNFVSLPNNGKRKQDNDAGFTGELTVPQEGGAR
jgi:hypothetical protein